MWENEANGGTRSKCAKTYLPAKCSQFLMFFSQFNPHTHFLEAKSRQFRSLERISLLTANCTSYFTLRKRNSAQVRTQYQLRAQKMNPKPVWYLQNQPKINSVPRRSSQNQFSTQKIDPKSTQNPENQSKINSVLTKSTESQLSI